MTFVIASVPEFAFFGFELEQFELPSPEAPAIIARMVELLGVIARMVELLGGVALIRRQLVLPAMTVSGLRATTDSRERSRTVDERCPPLHREPW